MQNNYSFSVTYSVSVSLEALERHLSNQLRDVLCEKLHVDSLTKAHVHVDVMNDGLTFYTIEVK